MNDNDWFFNEVGEDTGHKADVPFNPLNYLLGAIALSFVAISLVLVAYAFPVLALALCIMAMAVVVVLT